MHQRTRLDEVVAREWKENAFGRAIDRVAATTDALQKRRNTFWRGELHHEIDRSYVDTQLHRCRCDQYLEAARL